MPEMTSKCQDGHSPIRATVERMSCGGDYETVAVIKCQVCLIILETHRGLDYYEDGEAD